MSFDDTPPTTVVVDGKNWQVTAEEAARFAQLVVDLANVPHEESAERRALNVLRGVVDL